VPTFTPHRPSPSELGGHAGPPLPGPSSELGGHAGPPLPVPSRGCGGQACARGKQETQARRLCHKA